MFVYLSNITKQDVYQKNPCGIAAKLYILVCTFAKVLVNLLCILYANMQAQNRTPMATNIDGRIVAIITAPSITNSLEYYKILERIQMPMLPVNACRERESAPITPILYEKFNVFTCTSTTLVYQLCVYLCIYNNNNK